MVLPPVTSAPLAPQPAPSGAAAGTGVAAQAAKTQADPSPAAIPAAAALQMVLAAARQDAAAMQNGLSVLMANVLRASASGNLPPAVQSAVQQLVSLHLPTAKTPDAAAIKNALASSGLFTEAMLAEGAAPADLKSALGQLAQAAKAWQGQTPNQPQAQAASPNVPPPVRGGPPVAQGAALPSLPEGADPALTAKLLAAGSDAALARQSLLQMASLPDPQTPAESRWIFDVPLMTPQGAAVAQLIVTRDGKGTNADAPEPVWRIGLAIDIEPLGPVRANLALSGGHAWVTIGADRPNSLKQLTGNAAWLSEALTAVELDSDIAFQTAAPQAAAGGSRLVDHAL